MIRIYFDSNIFSNLRKNELDQYQRLNGLLDQYRHNLSFFFSYAHIRDKKNDTSPKKFLDFDFMEKFTGDNYIAYHPLEKDTTFYLATPMMVFNDERYRQTDISSLTGIFTPQEDDSPELLQYKMMLKTQMELTPLNLDSPVDETLSSEQRQLFQKMLPPGKINTMADFVDNFLNFTVEMNTNHQTYKDLRQLIDSRLNNGKVTLNDTFDFNEALKVTAIQKSFVDFVKSSVKPKANGNYPLYDFYLQAFNSLDLLGISKDKINRKNTYANLFNDGLHSYFGSFFDYLVTEDNSLTKKSKALYDTFGMRAKVISVNELIELLPLIGKDTEEDMLGLFGRLNSHRSSGQRIKTTIEGDGSISYIPIDQLYLNTFNQLLEQRVGEEIHYYLFEEQTNYLAGSDYREMGVIVNKSLELFGTDVYNKGPFDFEKEVEEIRERNWQGRVWIIGTLTLHLHKNKSLGSLCLHIRTLTDQPKAAA